MVLRYIFVTKDSLAFHNSSSVYIIYFAQQEKTLEQGEFSRICDDTHFITEISRRKKTPQLTTPRGVRRGHHSHFERRGMCGGAKAGGEQKLILRDPGLLGGCQRLME